MRVLEVAKRVRTVLGGHVVADTTRPLLVWETPFYPVYYVPAEDVRAELVPTGETRPSNGGDVDVLDVVVPGRTAAGAASRAPQSPIEALRSAVRLDWAAMDLWLEEDELVYVHARSPYVRVDILASSRHVHMALDGETVADSVRPQVLFETGLPPRFYFPLPDLRLDVLRASETVSHCPYKGEASYWSVEAGGRVHPDVVWTYRTPLPESQKIAGLACFYNERVDLTVDGTLLERPRTTFS